MNKEDSMLIAEYMGWDNLDGDFHCGKNFDLNDAGLCVEKMEKTYSSKVHKSNDWDDFSYFVFEQQGYEIYDKTIRKVFIPWLFNADNFFTAMASWLKEKK